MNLDIRQVGGEVLAVSQFTLMASTKKGNRPSYIRAAGEATALPLYRIFTERLAGSSADRSLRASSGPTCRWNSSMTAPSPSGWIRATGNNPLLQRFLPHRIPETTERGNDTAARSIAAFRPFSVAWHNFGYPLQRQDACTDATPPVPAEIPSCMHTPDRKRTASRRPKLLFDYEQIHPDSGHTALRCRFLRETVRYPRICRRRPLQ